MKPINEFVKPDPQFSKLTIVGGIVMHAFYRYGHMTVEGDPSVADSPQNEPPSPQGPPDDPRH